MEEKEVLSKVFHIDGSLRDIYVNEPITIDDWSELWKFFISLSKVALSVDGEKVNEMPPDITGIFKAGQNKTIYLSIDFNGIVFNCHFFSEEEVELDISPTAIKDIAKVKIVFDFMEILAKLLSKNVSISLENDKQTPLITVNKYGEFATYY